MPVSPYPIDITVYDTDNVTLIEGASVFIRNLTKGESSEIATTDANGVAMIDIASMPTDYSDDDKLIIVAYYKRNSDAELHTVDVSTGAYSSTVYLTPFPYDSCAQLRLMWAAGANTDSSQHSCTLYRVLDGTEVDQLEVAANSDKSHLYPDKGIEVNGGVIAVRESNSMKVFGEVRQSKFPS
jgi:hypothetical protein